MKNKKSPSSIAAVVGFVVDLTYAQKRKKLHNLTERITILHEALLKHSSGLRLNPGHTKPRPIRGTYRPA